MAKTKSNYIPKMIMGTDYTPKTINRRDVNGISLCDYVATAMKMALNENRLIRFDFNGIIMNVTPDMALNKTVDDIVKNCERKTERRNFLYTISANGIKRNLMSKLDQVKREKENKVFLDAISDVKFETDYELVWNSWKKANSDDFGAAIFRFAEIWAKLMQKEMEKNNSELTGTMTRETSRIANTEGISGFMYDHALNALVGCWKNGMELGHILAIPVERAKRWREIAIVKQANLMRKKQFVH